MILLCHVGRITKRSSGPKKFWSTCLHLANSMVTFHLAFFFLNVLKLLLYLGWSWRPKNFTTSWTAAIIFVPKIIKILMVNMVKVNTYPPTVINWAGIHWFCTSFAALYQFYFYFSKTAQLRFNEQTLVKGDAPPSLELPIKLPAVAQISCIAAISLILFN